MPINCRVCGRPLRSETSQTLGVGPVCSRRVKEIVNQAFQEAAATGTASHLDRSTLFAQALIAAQEAYRARIRRRRRQEQGEINQEVNQPPIPEDQTVGGVWSESRMRHEEIQIEFSDANHAIARSVSGHSYEVTSDSCSCPHFRYRLQGTGGRCRHLDAFHAALDQSTTLQSQSRAPLVEVRELTHEQNRRQFSQIDWEEEEAREEVLSIWRENRGFDGIYISRDDEAWNELKSLAMREWEYRYEGALGGTGNTFGVEIEFELPRYVGTYEVAQALYQADIIDTTSVSRYHGSNPGPGYWRLETDSSLTNGLELVSPVLLDRREHWEQIEQATKVLRDLGAYVNTHTGGHIHVGIAPLDHRAYSWQRLGRIGLAYEKQFFRMGAADSAAFERNERGIHRGTHYTRPLPQTATFISGHDSGAAARKKLSGDTRYTMFNATNVDANRGRKPTLEMRYPNGTLDPRQIQAQVVVANAVVHQAAVIRNGSAQSEFTPGLLDRSNQLRLNDRSSEAEEERNFRRFLDVLGNREDRLAATWLFLRGKTE